MVDVRVNHRFISTKPDSADPSLVSSSEWNDFEQFSQGAQGQHAVRDVASLSGASWVDGVKVQQTFASFSGASPTADLCAQSLTFTTTTYLTITANVTANVTGGNPAVVAIKRDGGTVDSFNVSGVGITGSSTFVIGEPPGTHLYALAVAATSGTFTSSAAKMTSFSAGVA